MPQAFPSIDAARPEPVGESVLVDHLRPLRVLLAVARQGTTVGAAQAVHLSQPAITRAIHRLEAVCGQPLFIRTTRGMQPTAQGGQLAGRVETLFGHLGDGAREAIAMAAESAGRQGARAYAPERFAQSVTPSQIRALTAVAACGSESQAAVRLGISQPAVAVSLQDLERQLSVRLFYKLPTGTRLTPPGEALLLRVKQAAAELRGMAGDIAAWHGQTRGRITIGVLPLSVPIFLPRAIEALRQRHPAVQVRIVDGTYEHLLRQLLEADIDAIAGALRPDAPPAQVQQRALFDDDLVVIAHRDHPCLRQRGLALRDLLQWPWVAPLPDTPADRVLRESFARHQLPPPGRQLCANSPVMTLALARQSGLLAIASRGQILLDDHGGDIRIVPVPLPSASRTIGLATRATTVPSPDLQALLDICQDTARALPGAAGSG